MNWGVVDALILKRHIPLLIFFESKAIIEAGTGGVLMMYGYMTLPDDTGIAHSEMKPDGS